MAPRRRCDSSTLFQPSSRDPVRGMARAPTLSNNRSQRGFPMAALGPETEVNGTDVEKRACVSIQLFFHSTNQAGALIGKYDLAPLPLRSSTARWQGSHPDRPRDQPYAIARR